MAVIEQVIDTLTFSSRYSCRDEYDYFDSAYTDREESWETHEVSVTTASIDTRNLTFSYNSIENETINMAVFSMESISTTFGGTIWVNDEVVYKSGDKYIAYLDPSIVGLNSTEIILKFQTYTPKHYHKSDYDSISNEYNYDTTEGAYGGAVYTKYHEGVLTVNNITLKIYTGDDFVSAPSTSVLFVGVGGVAKKVNDMFIGVSGIAKKVSDAWIGVNGVARKFWPCLELKDVPAGSKIQIDELGDGNLVNYIIVGQNHYLSDLTTEEHTVLLREHLLDNQVAYHSECNSGTYGNAYVGRTLDSYLENNWRIGLNGNLLMKLLLINVPIIPWQAYGSDDPTQYCERHVWIPSAKELFPSLDLAASNREGPGFEYFINNDTDTARKATLSDGTAKSWFTRTPVTGTAPYVHGVTTTGSKLNFSAAYNNYIRPVFCLPNSLPVSQISEGVYDLIV